MEQVEDGGTFQCKFCTSTFTQERYRERHQDDVHLGRLKTCTFCGKEMTASSLSRHYRTKTCQKPPFTAIHTKTTRYDEGDIAEVKEFKVQTTVQAVVFRDKRKGIISNEMIVDDLNVRLTCEAGNYNFMLNNAQFLVFEY